MARKKTEDGTQLAFFKGTEVWSAFSHTLPLLAKFMGFPAKGYISIKCTWRGESDFLAVAKRYGDDGLVQVLFGSGTDYVSALIGLEQAFDADKWRRDKWANG